jgi:hydroxylamine reductase (hybrid-cluster protein)
LGKKEGLTELGITSKYLDTLMSAVEQVRAGKLPPEKLKEIINQMKSKIEETALKLPEISTELKTRKAQEGLEAVGIIEDGISVYQKAFNILTLFLMESNTAHLEEGLKVVKEAQEKLIKGQEILSKSLINSLGKLG